VALGVRGLTNQTACSASDPHPDFLNSLLAGGEPVLDLRPAFGPEVVRRVLDALGSGGRAQYVAMLWTVDLVLPALFALALWAALSVGALRRWRRLALAAAAADYLENYALTALVLGHPAWHDGLAMFPSGLTATKVALYAVALALAAAGGLRARCAPGFPEGTTPVPHGRSAR
jgi:hypothetical protein